MQSYELQYKRLFSVISRVGDSHPEKQGSKLGLGIFFFFFFLLTCPFYGSITPSIYCIVTKSVWWNDFSGPGTIILKVNFLCINSARKPLLIHGFSPVNARLLTVYSTAFYAIILIRVWLLCMLMDLIFNCTVSCLL